MPSFLKLDKYLLRTVIKSGKSLYEQHEVFRDIKYLKMVARINAALSEITSIEELLDDAKKFGVSYNEKTIIEYMYSLVNKFTDKEWEIFKDRRDNNLGPINRLHLLAYLETDQSASSKILELLNV